MDLLTPEGVRTMAASYPLGLLLGRNLVEGHSYIYKFGFSDSIPTTESTVWDGVGTQNLVDYPTGGVVKVSSSSANDTSAGTGLQTVTVYGLDANWNDQSETITLNGQTSVNTTGSYIRVFRAVGEAAGSGGVNAGTIWVGDGTVTSGVPEDKFLAISPGQNQSLHAAWSVGNESAYVSRVLASSFGNANASATVRFCARPFGGVWQTKDKFVVTRGEMILEHMITPHYSAKTDFELRAIASSGTIDVSGAFEAYTYKGN